MYQNKHGRYTGYWDISTSSDWTDPSTEGGYNALQYGIHKLSLSFNGDMPVFQPGVTMEMMYARKNKMKFTDYSSVNKFKR
ncbi:hypothetical protein [Niabella hibiscisoli]|uniref:hypothetical protein n=1 Tax=Niabella hibiscisoli TaxID=1825928 RepID=UPI001F0F797F|nr:hypothetical protein [Niabella hibiscisoli]MCH5720644.1 hypothetical protein [Niabella hibiscisoli]